MVADERTNALIVSDIPAVLPGIDRIIQQMDRKTQEVEIEARVVSATRSFARDIGTQLGFGWGNGTTQLGGVPGAGGPGFSPYNGTATNPLYPLYAAGSSTIPLFSNLGASGPTSGIGFSTGSNNFRLDFALTMAESRGLLKVLSRPRVVTQNNIQAVVKQGVRVPIVTTSQLNGPSISRSWLSAASATSPRRKFSRNSASTTSTSPKSSPPPTKRTTSISTPSPSPSSAERATSAKLEHSVLQNSFRVVSDGQLPDLDFAPGTALAL